jgi:hypothetical protein
VRHRSRARLEKCEQLPGLFDLLFTFHEYFLGF